MTGISTRSRAAPARERWKFQAGAPLHSTPSMSGDLILFGCDDGALYALDHTSGRLRWKAEGGGPIWTSPSVYGGARVCRLDRRDVQGTRSQQRAHPLDATAARPDSLDGLRDRATGVLRVQRRPRLRTRQRVRTRRVDSRNRRLGHGRSGRRRTGWCLPDRRTTASTRSTPRRASGDGASKPAWASPRRPRWPTEKCSWPAKTDTSTR